jgi:hypothetical protein
MRVLEINSVVGRAAHGYFHRSLGGVVRFETRIRSLPYLFIPSRQDIPLSSERK